MPSDSPRDPPAPPPPGQFQSGEPQSRESPSGERVRRRSSSIGSSSGGESSSGEGSRRRRRSSRAPEPPPLTLGGKIVVGAVAALGLGTAGLAFIALWEITPLFGGWRGPPWLPLSGYYEWVTAQALKPGPGGVVPPAQIAKAEDATRHELRLSPMASDAWLRLVYIQTLKGPHLNAAGLDALNKSFIVAPLDPVNCGARDVLALNYWRDLTPALRRQVLEEIKVTWKPPTVVRAETLASWRSEVHDPGGRFALLLTLGPAPHP